MKTATLLFIASFLMIALPVSAQTHCGQFAKEWSACESDADCAPAQDACGWPAAYNKSHLGDADRYNRCVAPMIECVEPKEQAEDARAVCNDGVCGLPGK